jgi:hypothetical protein
LLKILLHDPCYKSNIPIGRIVKIISNDVEIVGKVKEILSILEYHPLGIKVLLDDEHQSEGRVIEIFIDESIRDENVLEKLSQEESITLEFKASLFTPTDTIEETMEKFHMKDRKMAEKKLESEIPSIIHASIKTIAAFANTDGGDLFIGVKDRTGEILGLECDFKNHDVKDDDGFLIQLKNQMKSHFNGTGIFAVTPKIEMIKQEGKFICHVQVVPSTFAISIKEKLMVKGNAVIAEVFYVRVSNSSEEFSPRDFYEKHWPGHIQKYLDAPQIVS